MTCPNHPERPCKGSSGLCGGCYNRWLEQRDPSVRERRNAKQKIASRLQDKNLKRSRWRTWNRGQPKNTRQERWLRQKYGITLATFEEMRAAQNDACKLCKTPFRNRRHIHIDHKHGTHIVRGLLCTKCNCGLGFFNEDPGRMRSAIAYLEISNAIPEQVWTPARRARFLELTNWLRAIPPSAASYGC